jgi:hypothetical protein
MYSGRPFMSDIARVPVEQARKKVQSGSALLVCAYDSDEKFKTLHLDGAISFSEFKSRTSSLSRDQEIIFYCA